jgi:hypothetical protein
MRVNFKLSYHDLISKSTAIIAILMTPLMIIISIKEYFVFIAVYDLEIIS